MGVWAHSGQEYLNCCDNSVPGLILQHIWCIHFSQQSHAICVITKRIELIYTDNNFMATYPFVILRLHNASLTCSTMDIPFTHISYNNTCLILIIIISYLVNIYLHATLVIVTHEVFTCIQLCIPEFINSLHHFQYSFVLTFLHLTFLSPVTVLPSKPK